MSEVAEDFEDDDDGAWYRDDSYSMEDWVYDVVSNGVKVGYIDWVISQYESEGDDPPSRVLNEKMDPQHLGLLEDGTADVPDIFRSRYCADDWVKEVENFDTRSGYESWLMVMTSEDPEWIEVQERIQKSNQEKDVLDVSTPNVKRSSGSGLRF